MSIPVPGLTAQARIIINNSAIPSGNGTKNAKFGMNYRIQLGYSAVHLVDYYIDLSKKNSSVSVALLTGCHDFQDP